MKKKLWTQIGCFAMATAVLMLCACKKPQTSEASPSARPVDTVEDSLPESTALPDELDLSSGYGYDEFLVLAASAEAQGDICAQQGLKTQAYTFYAASACELGSLRLGVEHFLAAASGAELADVSAGSLYTSFDELAALFPPSPYPDYFEGLAALSLGRDEEAETCWSAAVANAAYPDEGLAFTFLLDKGAEELSAMRDELRARETALLDKYAPRLMYLDRTPENSFTEYLLSMARQKLEENDLGEAMKYSEAAVLTDPFDGDCFASCAVCALAASDIASMAYYINEGLLIAPEHEGLLMLLEAYGHGGDEDEETE